MYDCGILRQRYFVTSRTNCGPTLPQGGLDTRLSQTGSTVKEFAVYGRLSRYTSEGEFDLHAR